MSEAEHRGPVVESHDGVTVMECTTCGWRHVWPLPSLSDMEAYYGESDTFYRTHSPPDWWALEDVEEPYHRLVYADYLDMLATYASKPLDKPLTLLDVGCGSGLLLHVAMHKGWEGTGIEPSPQARARAAERGVYVQSSMDGMKAQFDAAAMILVLEHVLDPLAMLRAIRERLVDGGSLIVLTPNDFNPLQEVARKVHGLPAWWCVKPHISYFSVESLRVLMMKAGFEIVDTRATWPVEIALLQGTQYVGNEELGRAMYREKMAYETALYTHGQTELLRQTQRNYAQQGIGREIIMVGVKES